jgi:hypothetical protein
LKFGLAFGDMPVAIDELQHATPIRAPVFNGDDAGTQLGDGSADRRSQA